VSGRDSELPSELPHPFLHTSKTSPNGGWLHALRVQGVWLKPLPWSHTCRKIPSGALTGRMPADELPEWR
jgi:hypothetical protein